MSRPRQLLMGLSLCLLLTACGGSNSGDECSSQFWNGTIGVCLSSGWEVLDRETLRQRGVPTETIAAFQAAEPTSGQFPTLAITQEKLPSEIEASRYSEASIRSVVVLEGYELVDQAEIDIDDNAVSMHIFTAQPLEGEPRRRFFQVSTTEGDTGYTATAVTPLSIDGSLESAIKSMLESITFVKPANEEE